MDLIDAAVRAEVSIHATDAGETTDYIGGGAANNVKLERSGKLTVEARNGYYAPTRSE